MKILFLVSLMTLAWSQSSAIYTNKYDKPKPEPIIIKEPTPTPGIQETVKVSWYGQDVCRGRKLCKTASGLPFNEEEYTAACWGDVPFFSVYRVSYGDNFVDVTCLDRGNFKRLGRFLDLSKAAFERLAPLSKGVITVNVKKIN